MIGQDGDDYVVDINGHHKLLIVQSESDLAPIMVECKRRFVCHDCTTGCGKDVVFTESLGALSSGSILPTGTYIFSIPVQFNLRNVQVDEPVNIDIILEPVIDEFWQVR